jgi:hypothetical protein
VCSRILAGRYFTPVTFFIIVFSIAKASLGKESVILSSTARKKYFCITSYLLLTIPLFPTSEGHSIVAFFAPAGLSGEDEHIFRLTNVETRSGSLHVFLLCTGRSMFQLKGRSVFYIHHFVSQTELV